MYSSVLQANSKGVQRLQDGEHNKAVGLFMDGVKQVIETANTTACQGRNWVIMPACQLMMPSGCGQKAGVLPLSPCRNTSAVFILPITPAAPARGAVQIRLGEVGTQCVLKHSSSDNECE